MGSKATYIQVDLLVIVLALRGLQAAACTWSSHAIVLFTVIVVLCIQCCDGGMGT